MILAVVIGVLTATVLTCVRLRPGPRLRGTEPVPDDNSAHDIAGGPTSRPRRERRSKRGPADLASWCDSMSRDLRGGSSLVAAVKAHPPPSGFGLDDLPGRLHRGVPLTEAVDGLSADRDSRAVITVLTACARQGGPAAQPLDRVASTLRRRAADDAERQAHSAQARASAVVMTVLPGAVLALMVVTSPMTRSVVASPIGVLLVALGAALNTVGWWWMRRIVSGRQR